MSWLYSQALVAEFSEASCSAGEQFARLNSTPIPQAYLPSDKMTAFSRPSRFGMTFAPLTDDLGAELLTWFLEASHARTSAPQAKEPESTANAPASGVKWRELSTRYDPASCSWKTHQCLWEEDLPWSSVTLPRWGLMRDGVCWELPTLERRTSANDAGLWPTPGAAKANNDVTLTCSGDGRQKPNKLGWAVAVQMWPTPTAMTNTGGAALCKWGGSGARAQLRKMVTPQELNGALNPTWVEWLMGWPLGWTDLQPSATDKYRNAPPLRGAA